MSEGFLDEALRLATREFAVKRFRNPDKVAFDTQFYSELEQVTDGEKQFKACTQQYHSYIYVINQVLGIDEGDRMEMEL